MSKIQPNDGASLWFKNKFGNARLDKKTDTKKTTDFKTELAKRLAQRRHKDLEMQHNFYNVENEISDNEEADEECDEKLSDNELNMCGEYVSNKKMYVIDDDEDLDEEKSLNENINSKEVHIQSELVVNQSVVDLFTVEDDDGDNQLNKSINEADKEEEDFEEEISKNVAESKQQNLKEMFDDEASLSGDDIGSDRDEMDDVEGMDEYEAEEGDHDKLNEDEIRDNLIRQYNKYERDADDKRLLKLQEAFFADSDLHNHVFFKIILI
uniref:Protein SDA1 n=1 Tax=Meloidogyne javanica TaxID=6303 RepID=A0A915M6E2_MELJA